MKGYAHRNCSGTSSFYSIHRNCVRFMEPSVKKKIISEAINFVLSNNITCNCIFFYFLDIPSDSKVNTHTYIYCRPAFRREKFWGFCQTLLKGRYITEFVFILPFIFTLQNLHDKWCGAKRLTSLFLTKLLRCLMKWKLANNRNILKCSERQQNNTLGGG